MRWGVSSTSDHDPLGTALGAIIIGSAVGGCVISLILLGAYWLPRSEQLFGRIALGGAAIGLLAAGTTGFAISRPLGTWRGGMVAMIALAGAAFVGILTALFDMFLHETGLAVLALLCIGAALAARKLLGRAPESHASEPGDGR